MLEFVMQQWRNVRQRAKVSTLDQVTNYDKEENDEHVDEDAQASSDNAESEVANTVNIKLNPKARKFAESEAKNPKFKRMKNPVLNRDAFYVLPPKLLTASSKPDRLIDTVQIKEIGSFSRQQIEIFKRIDNVKVAVELGIELHVWLTEEGLPALPAQYHGLAQDVATDILNSYPYKGLEGLANHADYKYTLLYRAQPPTWLTDAAIQACCERLIQKNND
ncbi:Hypothetical protein PHPALM_12711, partial [Phytophthora palmivora]